MALSLFDFWGDAVILRLAYLIKIAPFPEKTMVWNVFI